MDWERIGDRVSQHAPKLAAAAAVGMAAVIGLFELNAPGAPLPPGELHLGRAHLVMVETESCGWCRRFHAEVGPLFADHPAARRSPLTVVHARNLRAARYRLRTGVTAVPTFLLIDHTGRELGRMRGYPGSPQAFFRALERMQARHPDL